MELEKHKDAPVIMATTMSSCDMYAWEETTQRWRCAVWTCGAAEVDVNNGGQCLTFAALGAFSCANLLHLSLILKLQLVLAAAAVADAAAGPAAPAAVPAAAAPSASSAPAAPLLPWMHYPAPVSHK